MNKIAYINNVSKNLDMFHGQIMAAIAKGVWIVDWA